MVTFDPLWLPFIHRTSPLFSISEKLAKIHPTTFLFKPQRFYIRHGTEIIYSGNPSVPRGIFEYRRNFSINNKSEKYNV
ncbi:MAG: hypothetical protein ACTSRK_00010 [Promethearchaeota archaeon]